MSGSDLWSIGSASLEFVVGFDPSRTIVARRLTNRLTGRSWEISEEPDVTINLGTEHLVLGHTGPLAFVSATAQTTEAGVRLEFVFEHRTQHVRIMRDYAAYPGSPTIETWTRLEASGSTPIEVSDLTGWRYVMPFGPVQILGGLRGDVAGTEESAAFYLDERTLEHGERLEIGSDRRSSEDYVPFFAVEDSGDQFYGGVMWSAGWSVAFERRNETLEVRSYFPNVVTTLTAAQPVEVPHAFFGLTSRAIADVSSALSAFIIKGIRRGRGFQPLVTYNSWFPYGVRIDENTMVAEMDRAAAIGVELFVVDAGWWIGAGENGDFDFETGLGTLTEDGDRFPNGLGSLADYAHGLGMKFGLWTEPAGIALALLDKDGMPRESWLAKKQNQPGASVAGQICLAREDARQWVMFRLVELLQRIPIDYLKWDNNFWINCDRGGHGHGPGDGAFAHTRALYGILADLRRRFPELLIENVSGGGNRLDFGLLGLTDVGWMDDRSYPAAHVRHNLEGLAFAFPPGYLLSFVIDADGEPIAANPDLPLMVRSRMPGVLGLTYRFDYLYEDTSHELAKQIADYKLIRDIVSRANATLLSNQAPVDDLSWDVLQESADEAKNVLVFAFKGNTDDGRIVVRPRGLRNTDTYDVRSLDAGELGSARGDVLMEGGIEIVHNGASRAHVLILTARP